jgi:plasmid stabilization system protein ParE
VSRTVILQPRAEQDILETAGNIPDPVVGARWFDRIMAHIAGLSDSAEWYGLADEAEELGVELRETFFGKRRGGRYRIVFVIRDNVVRVLTVRRGSRDRLTADDL